jgi:hypothetical protein
MPEKFCLNENSPLDIMHQKAWTLCVKIFWDIMRQKVWTLVATVGTYTVMSPVVKWYKLPSTVGKLRFHGTSFLLCIESGYVE